MTYNCSQIDERKNTPSLMHSSLSSTNTDNNPSTHNSLQSSTTSIIDSYCSSKPYYEESFPWLWNTSQASLKQTSLLSSTSSDLHLVRRFNADDKSLNSYYSSSAGSGRKKWRLWTSQKIWLTFANTLLFLYGFATFMLGISTFCKLYLRAVIFVMSERPLAILVTVTGAIYNLLLWVCLGTIASIGYYSYRRVKWNIEGKLSYQWHYQLSAHERATIQANLHCCGYKIYSDFHESSNKCYPRTLYPGCRFKYQKLIEDLLNYTWVVAFSIMPVHIMVVISGLLCANHINNTFGKGLPPKLYHVNYKVVAPPTSSLDTAHFNQNTATRSEASLRRRAY